MSHFRVCSFVYTFYLVLVLLGKVSTSENYSNSIQKSNFNRSRFATKTSYFYHAKKVQNFDDDQEKVAGSCGGVAQQLWLVTRHGARYPMKTDIQRLGATLPLIAQEIVFNHKEGRGSLSEKEVKEMEQFVPPYSPRDAGQLHEAGAEEHYMLGQFWKKRFPAIFDQPYSEDLYKVEVTTANRTGQSAYHFLRGMFGDEEVGHIKLPKARKPNFKLRAYKSCPLWTREVLNNEATYREQKLYEKTPEFEAMVAAVSGRLGYTDPVPLSELVLIYDECRFEAAWWLDKLPLWCKFFSEQDIEVLEYHQALKYYYEDSYGGPDLNKQLACAAATDLFKTFRDAVKGGGEGPASPRAVLYFSHDKMLLQLLTLLGLQQPATPLTHNTRLQHRDGPFAISSIAPFSSNLAFVLHRCQDGSHQVSGLLQGEPVSLAPLCPTESGPLCSWPVTSLEKMAANCHVRQLCHAHDEL